jgi:hypothetical protein
MSKRKGKPRPLKPEPVAAPAVPELTASRLTPIRRRVVVAKGLLAIAGVGAFGAAFAVGRAHNPGQSKRLRLRPLAASPRYMTRVAAVIGDADVVVPPLASPEAATKQS